MNTHHVNLILRTSRKHLSKSAADWTLCLGAGINRDILPDWSDLTLNVINNIFKFDWDKDDFTKANSNIGFSYDSWIQACLNKHLENGETIETFTKILEKEIYGDLLLEAEKENIKELMVRFLNKPSLNKKERKKIIDFFEKRYSHTTLMQIVDALTSPRDKYKYPGSIITFNADTLLYSLLALYNEQKYSTEKKPSAIQHFKLILKSYHNWGDKIPVFHLHGSIFPESAISTQKEDGRENLIFLESSYSKVAGSMFTWAQTNFLYYALNTQMVFIGLSMSDPNIRKWLNWTTDTVNSDLSSFTNSLINSNRHIWMKPKPANRNTEVFTENSLIHLGIKMGWIKDYSEVKDSLLNIMLK